MVVAGAEDRLLERAGEGRIGTADPRSQTAGPGSTAAGPSFALRASSAASFARKQPHFRVDAGQLDLGLLLRQVGGAALRPDEQLDLPTKESQTWVSRCPSPPLPPLVPVARGARDRLRGHVGPLGDERALVAILNLDLSLEAAVLAEPCAAGAGNLLVLPGALRSERHDGLVGLQFTYARSANILSRSA